jgi:hypothetical protein
MAEMHDVKIAWNDSVYRTMALSMRSHTIHAAARRNIYRARSESPEGGRISGYGRRR